MKKSSRIGYKSFCVKRCFGVELELSNTVTKTFIASHIRKISDREVVVTGWKQSKDNDYWHVKYDSTCGILGSPYDKGWEVASYKGTSAFDVMHIAEVASLLAEVGVEVNNNCGLHVHVEVGDFTTSQMAVLLAYWVKIEWLMMQAVPVRRRKNKYCQSLADRALFAGTPTLSRNCSSIALWDLLKPDNLSPYENEDKRFTLNTVNYACGLVNEFWPRKTIELRLPEGTLDYADVKNWVVLFSNFVDSVKGKPMPNLCIGIIEEALDILGIHHDYMPGKFNIFSPWMYEARVWFLNRLLKFSQYDHIKDAASEILADIT